MNDEKKDNVGEKNNRDKTIIEISIDYMKPLAVAFKECLEWGLKWAFKIFLLVTSIFLFLKLFSLRFIKDFNHYFSECFFDSSHNLYAFLIATSIIIVFIVLFIIFYKLIDKFWSNEE